MWLRLETTFVDHPKVLAAGEVAQAAWLRLLAWSVEHRTDGQLPAAVVCREKSAVVKKLVDVGLLDHDGVEYAIHDFLDFQSSRAEWDAKSDANRMNARKRWAQRDESESLSTIRDDTKRESGSASRSRRAHTIPQPFEVTVEMQEWANRECPNVDRAHETKQFQDYHRARGSTFKDWPAAWRTWMRKAARPR